MTAPRIVPIAEAQALFGRGTKDELAAAARELAASVVALHAQVARLTREDYELARRIADAAIAAERERIAAWLRRKAMAGITAGLPETPTLLALLSYADAIAKNHTED